MTHQCIIEVKDTQGNIVELSKNRVDKLRLIPIKQILEDVKISKEEALSTGKDIKGFLPMGFVRFKGYLVHPSGLVLNGDWTKARSVKYDGDIYFGDGEEWYEYITTLRNLFSYNPNLFGIFVKAENMDQLLTIKDENIVKSVNISLANMRIHDVYLEDYGFGEKIINIKTMEEK